MGGTPPCPAVPAGQASELRPPRVVKEAEPVPAQSPHRLLWWVFSRSDARAPNFTPVKVGFSKVRAKLTAIAEIRSRVCSGPSTLPVPLMLDPLLPPGRKPPTV